MAKRLLLLLQTVFLSATMSARAGEKISTEPMDIFRGTLHEMSSAKGIIERDAIEPARILLATQVDANGEISSEARLSLAFRTQIVPPNLKMPKGPEMLVLMKGQLVEDEQRLFVLGIEILDEKPSLTVSGAVSDTEPKIGAKKIRIFVTRDQKSSPSHVARLMSAKLWGLVGENMNAPYQPAILEAIVLGTDLERSKVPALYSKPGSGTWTLFRITSPGEAFLAIDFENGIGEFFPKNMGQKSEAGKAIFHAL